MPTEDSYGQGVDIAALTDAPNAATLAFNIADAIAQRSVMRFSSASARNATLTAPVAGMMAALSTEKLLTWYDGSSWAVIGSGTSAWTNVPLASGFTHNGNGNGSMQYRVVNLFGEPTVMLQGALNVTYSGSNIANGGIVTSTPLPSSARPGSLRTVVIPCSDVSSVRITLKLDAQPDGHLKIYGTGTGADGTSKPPWIGFNGVFYSL
ncbi:hypothetical protein ACFYOY_13145 [Streptomyces sp. NPDC007875]|uniref:hypothetical protein n=1 Tax=Streptomyces sp. NPDC007875 TaxID=3364783 RepID=UPI0036C20728